MIQKLNAYYLYSKDTVETSVIFFLQNVVQMLESFFKNYFKDIFYTIIRPLRYPFMEGKRFKKIKKFF